MDQQFRDQLIILAINVKKIKTTASEIILIEFYVVK